MVYHPQDEDEEAVAGQAPTATPAAPSPAKWDPLNPSPDSAGAPSQGLGDGERVAKALARAGVASRREVERYIEAGRVALNGKVLDTPAVKVAPGDILTVDGAVVGGPEPTRLFRYHKPSGLITTNSDPQGRPTVFEHLPDGLPRVLAIGRLDLNTEGLLLLTNDGALSRALELPSSGWMRRYRARAFGRIDQDRLDALSEGVTVDGVAYGPIEARLDKATGHDRESGAANVWISIGITEGKNREVRKVLEHLGLKVNRLIRLAYGPFALGTLEVGQVEEVGPRVIREQLAEHVSPENLPTGDRPVLGVLSNASISTARPRPDAPSPRRGPPADAERPRPRPTGAAPGKAPGKTNGKTNGKTTGRPPPARRGPGSAPPAEGAERRLAEAPRKQRPGPQRGWVDKPGAGRARDDGPRGERTGVSRGFGGKPEGGRARDARAGDERTGARPATDRPSKPRPPSADRTSGERSFGDRPSGDRPGGKPGGKLGFKPSGPKSGARSGPKGAPKGGARPGAAPAAPSRTGLELTPPMRRTPRGSGPRRPPRKD